MKDRLTNRQQLFAETFALTGRASESAIAAGTNPASAHTRAYRWLKIPAVAEFVESTRFLAFQELRERIVSRVASEVMLGLDCGLSLRRVQRAQRLLYRLGIFVNDPFADERQLRREKMRKKAGQKDQLRTLAGKAISGRVEKQAPWLAG